MHAVVCVDVGSTFTKAAAVDVDAGRLARDVVHRTTVGSDVMAGVDEASAALAAQLPGVDLSEVRACSSAGGGLRLAVVGYERAVTAEAGFRVGLSAGAKVVHVFAGRLDRVRWRRWPATRRTSCCSSAARTAATPRCCCTTRRHSPALRRYAARGPGGGGGQRRRGARLRLARGVVGGARGQRAAAHRRARPAAGQGGIRDVFIRHVIGGKHLSTSPAFAAMVRAATPDAVLAGVELLSDGSPARPALRRRGAGDVVVVDVGGATTDVYSVVTPDPDEVARRREVVETLWRSRTVEGDLGVRWNAVGVVEAAVAERLLRPGEQAPLATAAQARADDPSLLPVDDAGRAVDVRLAELALTVALRRHARPQESGVVRTAGRDLRHARLVVGSGGVLRYATAAGVRQVLRPALSDHAGGWRLPEHAALAVDARYVLAAAGLLGEDHPWAAAALASSALRRLPANLRAGKAGFLPYWPVGWAPRRAC